MTALSRKLRVKLQNKLVKLNVYYVAFKLNSRLKRRRVKTKNSFSLFRSLLFYIKLKLVGKDKGKNIRNEKLLCNFWNKQNTGFNV